MSISLSGVNDCAVCGHDGHMASLLGAVSIMARNRDRIPSNCAVRLLFQPAEEGPGGAEPMVREGCLTGVSEVYGYHNWPTMKLGHLHVTEGAMMAKVTDVDITLRGSGVHASQPQNGLDPVVAAAQLVTALQTIVSRNLDPAKSAVLSITVVRGGEARNVIPDTVHLEGTLRTFDDDVYEMVTSRIRSMTECTAEAMGVKAEVTLRDAYPVLYNAKDPTEHVRRVARKVLGDAAVRRDDLPVFGAEDFGIFAQHRPGCFFFLGSAEPGRQEMTLHQSKYDFNDRVLPIAILMWLRLVEDRLGASWADLPASPDVNLVTRSQFHSISGDGDAAAGAGGATAADVAPAKGGGGRATARAKRAAVDVDVEPRSKPKRSRQA